MDKNTIPRIVFCLAAALLFFLLELPQKGSRTEYEWMKVPVLYGYSTCGNGIKETGEACDDSGTANGDGCSSACAVETGFLCSGSPSTCSAICGDGLIKGSEGCDDDGTTSGDGCSSSCAIETGFTCSGTPSSCSSTCGDGTKASSEACDDGDTDSGDGCSSSCAVETGFLCGSSSPSSCSAICGDGLIKGSEQCDDDGTSSSDGCSSTCTIETGYSCTGTPSVCSGSCGDGIMRGSETCDDGNNVSSDGCSSSCTSEHGFTCTGVPSVCSYECGDGVRALAEACDDGDLSSGDGCSESCTVEQYYSCSGEPSTCSADCGDGVIYLDDECDDGNELDNDGCSDDCIEESGWTCAGEPSVCYTTCGDNVVAGDEECDPPGSANCSLNCMNQSIGGGSSAVSSISGRSLKRADAKDYSFDFTKALSSDIPVRLRSLSSCGNGNTDIGEECDDSNNLDNDGCSSYCYREIGYCGDGLVQRAKGEECEPEKILNEKGAWEYPKIPKCVKEQDLTFCADPSSKDKACLVVSPPLCDLPPEFDTQNVAYCGDGRKDSGEECDFGSICFGGQYHGSYLQDRQSVLLCSRHGGKSIARPGDGCGDDCRIEQCGDGAVQFREKCDNGRICSGDYSRKCSNDFDCSGAGKCVYDELSNVSCTQACDLCDGIYSATIGLEGLEEGEHILKVRVTNACGENTVKETRFISSKTISRASPYIPAHSIDLKKDLKAGSDGTQPTRVSVITDKSKYIYGVDNGVLVSVIVADNAGNLAHSLPPSAFEMAVDGKIFEGPMFLEDIPADCIFSGKSKLNPYSYECAAKAIQKTAGSKNADILPGFIKALNGKTVQFRQELIFLLIVLSVGVQIARKKKIVFSKNTRRTANAALAMLVLMVIAGGYGSMRDYKAVLSGAGTALSPYVIRDCRELQSIRLDPNADYMIANDIDCSETGVWNSDSSCANLGRKECAEKSEKCFWDREYSCVGEKYEGCAFSRQDCMEWCGGRDWKESASCETMYGFIPIGTPDAPFTGVLNGSGHTVSGLNVYWPEKSGIGLFGETSSAEINSLRLLKPNVRGRYYVGGIAGSQKGGSLDGIAVEQGAIEGRYGVGGLAGIVADTEASQGKIYGSMAGQCSISGLTSAGGLAGIIKHSSITESAVRDCAIAGKYDVGGLVGENYGGTLKNVSADSESSAGGRAAGIAAVNLESGKIINALSVGESVCPECSADEFGGIVSYNDKASSAEFSYYSGSKVSGTGKGIGKTPKELRNVATFEDWDFNLVWRMGSGSYPSLVLIDGFEEKILPGQYEEKPDILADGETIKGFVSHTSEGEGKGGKKMIIAVSVNGGAIEGRGETDGKGGFSVSGVNASSGDLITVFTEGMKTKAVTVVRKTAEPLPDVTLKGGELRLGGTGAGAFTSKEIGKLYFSGQYPHPSLEAVFAFEEDALKVQDGKVLSVVTGSTLKLNSGLSVYDLVLFGKIVQGKHDVTVRNIFLQGGGSYVAGEGNIAVKGDMVMEGGVFKGGKGRMRLLDDLAGTFLLKGGKFIAPSSLEVWEDWISEKGVFDHNKSKVIFAGTSHVIDVNESEKFYDVTLQKQDNSELIVTDNDVLKISNKFKASDGRSAGGSVDIEGSLLVGADFDGGDTMFNLEGNGNIDAVFTAGGKIPRMRVNAQKAKIKMSAPEEPPRVLSEEGNAVIFNEPFTLAKGEISTGLQNAWFHSDVKLLGGTMKIDSGNVIFSKPLNIEGGTLQANSGSITLNAPFSLSGGYVRLFDTQLNANGDVYIKSGKLIGGAGNMVMNGNLTMTGGTFFAPSNLLTLGGALEKNEKNALFAHNGGTVVFEGTSSSASANKTVFANIIVKKNPGNYLSIESGAYITVLGDLSVERGALSGGLIKLKGDLSYTKGAGTGTVSVEFAGPYEQSVSFAYPERFLGNITIKKTGSAPLKLNSGLSISRAKQEIYIKSGVLDLNKQDIRSVPKITLKVAKSAELVFRGLEEHPVLDLRDGSKVRYVIDRGPQRLDVTSYSDLILDSARGLRFYPSEKGLTVNGDLTIAGGVLEADKNQMIAVNGGWNFEGGSFVSGNSTVILGGAETVLKGNNTFFNLTKQKGDSILVLDDGGSTRVNGKLILAGDECKMMKVRPSNHGGVFDVTVMGSNSLKSLDLRGLKNSSVKSLICSDECLDSGNNENIEIEAKICKESDTSCGDGEQEEGEKCDDGNILSGDGCSAFCAEEDGFSCKGKPVKCAPVCGDKKIAGEETCDDGGKASSDGCSKLCKEEAGFACGGEPSYCEPVCGDGFKIGKEECDDKNSVNGDGCNEFCLVELGFTCETGKPKCEKTCGNKKVDKGEECDDGNSLRGDGCTPYCEHET